MADVIQFNGAFSLEDLKLVLVPGQRPPAGAEDYYQEAFNCWYSVWSQAFLELGIQEPLHSDTFTRQDLVTALFLRGKCLGLTLMRFPDSNLPIMARDSYFSNWRPEDIQALSSRGARIVVCSNFTLDPVVRRQSTGINFKSLLTGIATYTFSRLQFDAMTGAMRRSRNVHLSTYEWGALPIAEARPSGYGDEVDLIGIFKSHLNGFPYPKDLIGHVQRLWGEKLCFVNAGGLVQDSEMASVATASPQAS